MIPITQTKVVVRNSKGDMIIHGNCYAAAIASILELPIEQVPNVELFFEPNDGFWLEIMNKFLALRGLQIETDDRFKSFHRTIDELDGDDYSNKLLLKDEYYFVSGESPRGVKHITIYQNGQLVHDPHPTREGLLSCEIFEVIRKIDK